MKGLPAGAAVKSFRLPAIYGTFFILSAIAGFAVKLYYREYIYSNHIFDFYLAGSGPSLFSSFGSLFLYFTAAHLSGRPVTYNSVIWITLGCLSYELFPLDSKRTFDFMDIIAIIAGSIAACGIFSVFEPGNISWRAKVRK